MEEYELRVREDLREKLNFVLSDFPYNLHADQNAHHVVYDELGENNIKEMVKVSVDIKILGG